MSTPGTAIVVAAVPVNFPTLPEGDKDAEKIDLDLVPVTPVRDEDDPFLAKPTLAMDETVSIRFFFSAATFKAWRILGLIFSVDVILSFTFVGRRVAVNAWVPLFPFPRRVIVNGGRLVFVLATFVSFSVGSELVVHSDVLDTFPFPRESFGNSSTPSKAISPPV